MIKAKIALYSKRGKPARRSQVINFSDHDIVRIYGAEKAADHWSPGSAAFRCDGKRMRSSPTATRVGSPTPVGN
ncbi:hypothetical protein [Streptomyces iranensis]|uniref:hypothetical protein n=1 Tax=Streptomyces iranensis TaxID=576784 RepID=UPI0039B77527